MDLFLGPSSTTRRKNKFAPKAPSQREIKPTKVESELAGDGDTDAETNETLMRKVNEHLKGKHPKAEKKSSVQVAFSQGVSTSIRTFGVQKEATGEIGKDKGLANSTSDDAEDFLSLPSTDSAGEILEISENAVDPLFKKKKKRAYKEPWDYKRSYYPTTLPLRRPFSGDPELLDEEEFGEASTAEYDENTINSASDLGLLNLEEEGSPKMIFFQLPAEIYGEKPTNADKNKDAGSAKDKALAGSSMPRGIVSSPMAKGKEVSGQMVSASRKGKEKADSSTSPTADNASKKECSSKKLPAGHMGKMLVYKSGAIKLKIGDILYDVSPGSDCSFAQEIMTVNTVQKQCSPMGKLNKLAVVTPDITSLLDSVTHLED